MAKRRYSVLTLMAAGTIWACLLSPTSAQVPLPSPKLPPTGMPLTEGLITSAEGIELAPGEQIIDGPPELKMFTEQALPSGQLAGAGGISPCGPSCYDACDPFYYVIAEALYMQRRGLSGSTLSTGFAFDDYEFEIAPRVTLGRQFDCTDGYEFIFTGMLDWEERLAAVGPGLNTVLVAAPPLDPAVFDPFRDSTFQSQGIRASYDSYEFHRTYNGWDVVRTLVGLRTILYDEEYYFIGTDGVDNAILYSSADNVLVGPQLGLEMLYPVNNWIDVGARFKGGLYLNFADAETRLFNDAFSTTIPAAGGAGKETTIAGALEISSQTRMRLTNSITGIVGFDMWYLGGLVETRSQLPNPFPQNAGNFLDPNDEIFFLGVTGGIQVVF